MLNSLCDLFYGQIIENVKNALLPKEVQHLARSRVDVVFYQGGELLPLMSKLACGNNTNLFGADFYAGIKEIFYQANNTFSSNLENDNVVAHVARYVCTGHC